MLQALGDEVWGVFPSPPPSIKEHKTFGSLPTSAVVMLQALGDEVLRYSEIRALIKEQRGFRFVTGIGGYHTAGAR